ncbi:hypothetical protein K1719_009919 [Acacia pycnantha]|nr:hypothetical protein K1719_009919 [Acacia pycnantha]
MSYISLKLPPARKIWKSFTSTIGKLRRINKSKAIKKPRKLTKRTSTTLTSSTKRPYKLPSSRRFGQKKLAGFRSVFYGFHWKPAPVYIDKLFKEPSCDIVKHVKPEMAENPPTRKASKLGDEAGEVAGTSNQGGGFDRDNIACSSDDMWESLALASPLMQGINERAEEFIARFKKEMVAQELLARNL